MKILSVNAGSSSLKYQLFLMPEEKVLISGVFEKIGFSDSFYSYKIDDEKKIVEMPVGNHEEAVKLLIEVLIDNKVIASIEEIDGIGHRIVHGGDKYSESIIVDEEVIKNIGDIAPLAPLHNPAHLDGINGFRAVLPNVKMVTVFDTAFHSTMESKDYMYALPYAWYEKHQIRKYGFHGTSHRYVAQRISEILKRNDLKIIICHLGNGGSLSAVKNGKCIDTSMGFTPLAGIVMGTRSGDVDPSIIPYIMKKENKTIEEIIAALNKESGLLGISGISSDSRDIEEAYLDGNERALLAHEMSVKSIVGYIAKYYVELEGCDCICFTAGIGENSSETRKDVLAGLKCLGVTINEEANKVRGTEAKISGEDSKIAVYVVPTNEELMIAQDTYRLIG